MEILLLDLLNIYFDDYRCRVLKLSTKNLNSKKYEKIYLTDELKTVQKTFELLNSNRFYYGEYVSPYYVHYVDLDDLKIIIDDLFKIEKKKNKYLKIENFKQRVFQNQLYYNRLFLNNEKYSSLEWRGENCFSIYEYGELKSKNLLIFDDYFQDENMIYDYFQALNDLLINYEFDESLLTTNKKLIKNVDENFDSFENDDTATQDLNIVEEEDISNDEKLTVPKIIKILDKLNIRGWMKDKGFTDFQTTQLLADIFNRSEKTIRNNFDNKNHDDLAEEYIKNLKSLKAKR